LIVGVLIKESNYKYKTELAQKRMSNGAENQQHVKTIETA